MDRQNPQVCDGKKERRLTARGLVLPHPGLDHVGLDGTAGTRLVVVGDGAASPALLVQVGVGRLGALGPLAGAGQGVGPHLSVGGRNRMAREIRISSKSTFCSYVFGTNVAYCPNFF